MGQVSGNQLVGEAEGVDGAVKLVEGGTELGGGWDVGGDDLGQAGTEEPENDRKSRVYRTRKQRSAFSVYKDTLLLPLLPFLFRAKNCCFRSAGTG